MARAPLSFERAALIGLEAVPQRLLRSHATDEQIITELLHIASQFPKRSKRQLELHGPGTPTVRLDLIAIAIGRQLRAHRLYVRRHGQPDYYRHDEVARLLRLAGEAGGGLDEGLIRAYEWPPVSPRPLNLSPQQARDWELEWLEYVIPPT
jgi:hypothetical protein